MRVLLVGAGAREHTIGWALRRSGRVTELLSLPGNPGLGRLGPVVEGVDPNDAGAVAAVARVHDVDLVIIGPEGPLAAGVSDAVAHLGIPVFGPSRAAARLESSKTFAKSVMQRAGVPTPSWKDFEEQSEAERYLTTAKGPYVVKADGLAAGKGVLVTDDRDEALGWVGRCFGGVFGSAGARVVVEEHLAGPELSVFAVSDGVNLKTLAPARDYKRLTDGGTGPNTGGMGSFSPVDLPDGLVDDVLVNIIQPTIDKMAEDGNPYVGFLYAGLILTEDGPSVIEFNARLGDPEAQVVLPRLETPLLEVIESALDATMADLELDWSPAHAVNVVLAVDGYPNAPRVGERIHGDLGPRETSLVFHAGTGLDKGRLVTSGGRVLSVVGLGEDRASARATAYERAESIRWTGQIHRSDIADE